MFEILLNKKSSLGPWLIIGSWLLVWYTSKNINRDQLRLLSNISQFFEMVLRQRYYHVRITAFYYEMRQFYYKIRQLLQPVTILPQNATVIAKCYVYYKLRQ